MSPGSQENTGTGTEKPNIIVFFTDEQRWDTVGAYGCPLDITPNADRLAAGGTLFRYAMTSAPLCAPARSSILTGKYPTKTGVVRNGLTLADDEVTIAHMLRRRGYEVGYVGKWHLGGTETKPVPLERRGGFDQWWEAADLLEYTSMPYDVTLFDADNRPIKLKNYRVDALTDRAVEFLRQKRSKPFFLFLSYLEPHHQNSPDGSFPDTFMAPKGYAERFRNNFYIPRDLWPYPGDWKSQLPDYYGIVARLDECLGRIMKELKDLGVEKNTILVFTTDHGCHFRTRNAEYKRSCHESSIRIPFIIGGPGFEGGCVVENLVSTVDLVPTLLDCAGVQPPASVQGKSVLPLIQGKRAGWRKHLLTQISESELGRGLRTGRWKYCVYDPTADPNTVHSTRYKERYFYDLHSDPHEHVNLVGRDDFREVADDLRKALADQMVEIGEPLPAIEPARFYA
ncbi:MAG TPA: sulfatase-like hydrolase/transferase [Bryobacteraceae bacterium]|jgi:arylsulfatase A-like enzyme